MKNPGELAGEESKRLHKLAFPEVYKTQEDSNTDGVNTDTTHTEGTTTTESVQQETKTVEVDFKHKYDVLLGKYNAEVPRLHDQVRSLTEENTRLKTRVEIQPIQTSTEIPELKDQDDEGIALYRSPYVTDDMRGTDNYKYLFGEYGQTYAERHLESSVLAARTTVKPVEDRMENVTAKTAEEHFNAELSGICPPWQGLNAGVNIDPDFIAWLQGKNPGSRNTLHAELIDAYKTADAGRMAEIINSFLTTKPISITTNTVPDELIAPHKTGGGRQTVLDNTGGNVLRMSDMNQLYKDYNEGKYRGKETEYQKKKAAFMKASSEGRLIP